MLSLNDLKTRLMTESDLEMVLDWRNSEHVRHFSLTNQIIKLEDHLNWFEKTCNDASSKWLIAEWKTIPIGVISITDINNQDSTCSWGFYIGEPNKYLGVGILMEIHAIDNIVDQYAIRKIWGQALETNRIILTHKRFGYVVEGVLKNHLLRDGKYENIVLIALFTENWPEKRQEIISTFNLKKY